MPWQVSRGRHSQFYEYSTNWGWGKWVELLTREMGERLTYGIPCVYVCVHVCVSVHVHVCVHVFVCVCMCVSIAL